MKIKNIILTFILLLFCSQTFAQVSRIKGMGNLFLVIEDDDNHLSLYDKGKNSAYLLDEENKDWLKISGSTVAGNGTLHLPYDPAGINSYRADLQALKIIDENQIFIGSISYWDDRNKDINKAIQRKVYGTQPFILMDSTTGTIDYNGPMLKFEYAINLSKDFTIGAKIGYGAEQGIKKIYSKPEFTNSYADAQLGICYSISENIFIGMHIDPFYNIEKINLITDPELGTDPITFRYRGLNLYRKVSSANFDRFNRNKGFRSEIQSQYASADSSLMMYIAGGLDRQSILCWDGTEKERKEGYWLENRYTGNFQMRYRPKTICENLLIGASVNYIRTDAWAKNPLINFLYIENDANRTEITLGLSYNFNETGLLTGIEYQHNIIDSTLNDYVGDYNFSGSLPSSEIRIGIEYNIFKNFWLRLGYNYYMCDPKPEMGLIKNNYNLFTFGSSYLIKDFVKLDLLIDYGKRISKDLPNELSYKETKAILFAKFFVF